MVCYVALCDVLICDDMIYDGMLCYVIACELYGVVWHVVLCGGMI